MEQINIVVAGAFGRMGQEVCRMVEAEEGFRLVAIVDPRRREGSNAPVFSTLREALESVPADVLIDFTKPDVVYEHTLLSLESGVRPVVGTTGLQEEQIAELSRISREKKIGAVIAPNFAIGAVLMMKFAQIAAKYMPHVEIIEYHHDQKLDAPSGTASKTAEMISKSRNEIKQGHPQEKELLDGVRGGYMQGFRIHSVRLPGFVAHQEVIFGGEGQFLTIRHDSVHRSSFMPGVKLAVQKVMSLDHLVYGLENLIE